MPKPCPQCSTGMLPADDMNCEQANYICPECAPQFVVANATTFADIEDPLLAQDKRS